MGEVNSNSTRGVIGSGKPRLDRRAKPVGITCAITRTEVLMVPKYPGITVPLTGTDGNAYAILGKVRRALCQAHVPDEERQAFMQEARQGSYDELLQTVMRWVEVT
jgi:hypothetical protein